MKLFITLLLSLAITLTARPRMIAAWNALATDAAQSEVLYLPQLRAVEFLSFGFKNVLSDILWFNTINYFGKHYRTDQSYQWLRHMCSLVIALDPRAKHTYEFCSQMVSWEVKDHKGGLEILNQAIDAHPLDWRYPYLRGFHRMFFNQDSQGAHDDFLRASQLPDAHPITARLAAKEAASLNQPEQAVEFLQEMMLKSKDSNEREAFRRRLEEVWFEIGFKWNSESVAAFVKRFGRAPTSIDELVTDRRHLLEVKNTLNGRFFLVLFDDSQEVALRPESFLSAGAVRVMLRDPFGGKYYLDEPSGEVRSTSKQKRLSQYRQSPILKQHLEEQSQ